MDRSRLANQPRAFPVPFLGARPSIAVATHQWIIRRQHPRRHPWLPRLVQRARSEIQISISPAQALVVPRIPRSDPARNSAIGGSASARRHRPGVEGSRAHRRLAETCDGANRPLLERALRRLTRSMPPPPQKYLRAQLARVDGVPLERFAFDLCKHRLGKGDTEVTLL